MLCIPIEAILDRLWIILGQNPLEVCLIVIGASLYLFGPWIVWPPKRCNCGKKKPQKPTPTN